MNTVARGKLGKLLLTKKISNVSEQQKVSNSSDEDGNSLSLEQSSIAAAKQAVTAEDQHMHDPESSDSDSDTSSVGDHLVDPSTINLDETFFSQTFQGQSITAKKDADLRMYGEVTELSESEDENAITMGEEEQMNQILTQVSDYDRLIKEVNVCNESLERRRKEMEMLQQMQTDDYDVPFLLTQTEDVQGVPCAGDNLGWERVVEQNVQSEKMNNIEIIVSSSLQKPKRVLTAAEKLKRLEQEHKKKMFLNTHTTHLLLLLAYGIRINRTVNHGIAQYASELYELIGNSDIAMGDSVCLDFIQSVTAHYKTAMKLTKNAPRVINQRNAIECQLAAREVTSRQMLNVILLTLLRFLSVRARLVMNLDVVPKHPPTVKPTPKEKCPNALTETISAIPRYGNVPLTTTEILKRKPEIQKMFQLSQLDGADDDIISNKKARIELTPAKPRLGKLTSSSSGPNAPKGTSKRSAENSTNGKQKVLKLIPSKYFPKKHAKNQMIGESENIKTSTGMPNFAKLRKKSPELAGKDEQTSEEIPQQLASSKYFRKKPSAKQTMAVRNQKCTINDVPNLAKLRHQSSSTASESAKKTEHKYRIPELDTWIECYLEKERRWTVVEAGLGSTDCLDAVIDRILAPPLYAFAWEADGTIVDVSPRYRWRNEQLALKNRVDTKWLQKTLAPYRPRVLDEAHLQEQFEFRQLKLRAPRPTTIAQCKNHPSYCLHRHLQKFQAIYPPDAPPLGFVQGEPLYARECVHTLHSREVWLRHAKVIRHFEQPYKIVRTKLKRQQADLELFGYWQTEEYIPPEPVNGIVPRNAYGNIEIFKECMLPKGTVHLKHYGLSYICRKLGIDYAVAVVGFGVHAGGNHPIFDGIVICEEHQDRLLEAWQRHQDEATQKKIEKKQHTVLKNWVKLVKGLLVRKRLKNKYNFEGM